MLLTATGCSAAPHTTVGSADRTGTAGAAVARAADCRAPQVLGELGLRDDTATARPPAPPLGPLPEGFVPVGVVTCTADHRLRDTAGEWAAVTERRLDGNLHPLLDALGRPSVERPDACAEDVPIQLWLVDTLGAAVRVIPPLADCRTVLPAVARAIDALTVVDEVSYPVELLAPRSAESP